VEPIPTLPAGVTVTKAVPVEEATTNGLVVGAEDVPCTNKVAVAFEVPIPIFPTPLGLKSI
jgi:hypothetical protein